MREMVQYDLFINIKPSRYAVSEGVSAHGGARTMNNDNTNGIVLRGEGTDCIWNLIQDGYIRPILVDGLLHVSMVDVVRVFKPKIKNPRQYWKDHKLELLAKDWDAKVKTPDPELVAHLYRLKLPASDGKNYRTDVGSLWLLVYVGGRLSQPFYKHITKSLTLAELRQRVANIARGAEWRADTNHREMADLEPPEPLSAYQEMGYQ